MKFQAIVLASFLVMPYALADDQGGLKQDAAPPPPHAIEDGYRGTDDAKKMTVDFAKTMHDGASVSLRGNLISHKGEDRYVFRDKSGEIYLASWTRDYETVYRYGGEEFIIIVKAANDEEACRAGVRICQLVDNHAITHSEGHINITVTAGVSRAFPEEPLDVVIGRADRAMYEGKQTGRNRCMFIDEQNVIYRV